MRVVKSILRLFLALQAVILILLPIAGVIGSLRRHSTSGLLRHASSGLAGYGVLVLVLAIGLVFAKAWWSTRRPSAEINGWALAASAIYLLEGIAYSWLIHRYGHGGASGLDLVVVGAAGLFVFSRREAEPDAASSRKRQPVAGDRTSPVTRQVATALSTLAQIAAIILWSHWAFTNRLHGFHGISWIALVTIAAVLATVIHECGHAIMAWCFEMGLLSFKAGPFQWRRKEGKWSFKFVPAGFLTPAGAVGAVSTVLDPPRWEELVVIASGPAANLLIGIPAIYAVLHDRWSSFQFSWELVAFVGSFCVIAGVLNLFPFMSEDGAYSDGARMLQIVTHSPLDDYHRAMASIASTTLSPRRYRDLDIAQIERAAILFPNEFRGLHLLLCASHYYEDSGRMAEASASLAAAESIYNNNSIDLPGPLHTIFILGHACLNHDAAAARLWWDRMEAKGGERTNIDYWLARTALLWIEGDKHGAEDAWQEANLEAQSLPIFGAYEFDRSRCARLREALDNPELPQAASSSMAPAVAAAPADFEQKVPDAASALAETHATVAARIAAFAEKPVAPAPAVLTIPMPAASAEDIAEPISLRKPDAEASVTTTTAASAPDESHAAVPEEIRPPEPTPPQDAISAALARMLPARPAIPLPTKPAAFRIPDIPGPAKQAAFNAAPTAAPPGVPTFDANSAVGTFSSPLQIDSDSPIPVVDAAPAPLASAAAVQADPVNLPVARTESPQTPETPAAEFRLPEPPKPPARDAHDPLAAFFRRPAESKASSAPVEDSPAPADSSTQVNYSDPLAFFRRAEEKNESADDVLVKATVEAPRSAVDPLAFFRNAAQPKSSSGESEQAVPPPAEVRKPASDPLAFFRQAAEAKSSPAAPRDSVSAPPASQGLGPTDSAADAGRELTETPSVPAGTEQPIAVEAVAACPPATQAVIGSDSAKPEDSPSTPTDVPPTHNDIPANHADVPAAAVEPVVVPRGSGSYTRIPASGLLPPKPVLADKPKVDPLEFIRSEMIENLRKTAV